MAEECMACDFIKDSTKLPGGRIYETRYWVVEHCVGPLGVGTLIVKPKRHCLSVGDLLAEESVELGPLLKLAAAVVTELKRPNQVYVCLWSHAGWKPVHIHFVVQPISSELRNMHAKPGPFLQAEMFDKKEFGSAEDVRAFAQEAVKLFISRSKELLGRQAQSSIRDGVEIHRKGT